MICFQSAEATGTAEHSQLLYSLLLKCHTDLSQIYDKIYTLFTEYICTIGLK